MVSWNAQHNRGGAAGVGIGECGRRGGGEKARERRQQATCGAQHRRMLGSINCWSEGMFCVEVLEVQLLIDQDDSGLPGAMPFGHCELLPWEMSGYSVVW